MGIDLIQLNSVIAQAGAQNKARQPRNGLEEQWDQILLCPAVRGHCDNAFITQAPTLSSCYAHTEG